MNRPTLIRIRAAGTTEDHRTLEEALSDALIGRNISAEGRGGANKTSDCIERTPARPFKKLNGKNPEIFT